ncbi:MULTISPECIES: ParB/Srx family N-terminal domain-containing protein [unclassified Caballeronia]|uniref:ParB/Srx family N-terminal domain-containing protein n=1 Tax=unclassified Caballeronia TaxID=2646786 RepID=UPI00285665EF|nr:MULTISPECIES: ParB/Srx family N-terminal domain-containing protein [unclassified Caballeronia]MDR5755014.1 ParB/Srx family N-terminal domain-containing protein [Caballeronia sp. LZ024]MDR5845576.1 ParB/Srx family N-terminal domain-containing protein [Caballeronia sp. LZ031]
MNEGNRGESGVEGSDSAIQVEWDSLRPTQGAVGYVQVLEKNMSYLGMPAEKRGQFLREQAIKVVRGPSGTLHVVDHHHWARAWFDLGLPKAVVRPVANFSDLTEDVFIERMAERGWLHAFDKDGREISVQDLPHSIAELPDDIFQSLAAFLRMAGIYDNPGEFNAKFAWADFLRQHVDRRPSTVEGFARMFADAVSASRLPEAVELPGFIPSRSQ